MAMLTVVVMLAAVVISMLVGVEAAASHFWFSFGDSYTQTQFNYTLGQPNDANPLGNPELPGVTACGEVPNWVNFDVFKYNTTQVFAFNFAMGGATIDTTIVPSPSNVLDIGEQIGAFEKGYAGDTPFNDVPWTGANTLFSTWVGINDIGGSYLRDDDKIINDLLMNRYVNEMQHLIELGARNFAFLNVPPTDRSPALLSMDDNAQTRYTADVADFNSKLAARVAAFQSANPSVSTWLIDTYAVIDKLIDDPTKYGFQDATSFGDGNQFIWCNALHISPATHNFVAQAVAEALSGTGLL